MHPVVALSSLALGYLLAFAVKCEASLTGSKQCAELRVRYEWRSLQVSQKHAYINAVKCLQRLPAHNSSFAPVKTRFDEVQALHINMADAIHIVGHFLPWHRQFTLLHENLLRRECGYRGPMPYWNWTQDADSPKPMRDSPIFDPVTGFGGDGVADTYTLPTDFANTSRLDPYAFKGCVNNGPFASYTIRLGPGKLETDHCLTRGINDTYKQYLNSVHVANATKQSTFELFRIELEGRPVTPGPKMHDGGHVLVGGEMSNFYSSPGDPLFFLHHANLDRIWWEWQQVNPGERLYQISGRSTVNPPYTNVTLAFPLEFGNLGPTVSIRDVMDIRSEPSCYIYL